jgi:hypothetical protein
LAFWFFSALRRCASIFCFPRVIPTPPLRYPLSSRWSPPLFRRSDSDRRPPWPSRDRVWLDSSSLPFPCRTFFLPRSAYSALLWATFLLQAASPQHRQLRALIFKNIFYDFAKVHDWLFIYLFIYVFILQNYTSATNSTHGDLKSPFQTAAMHLPPNEKDVGYNFRVTFRVHIKELWSFKMWCKRSKICVDYLIIKIISNIKGLHYKVVVLGEKYYLRS